MDQPQPPVPQPPAGPPQVQSQWTPPPQQPQNWGGPGYSGPPQRPIGVTLGSIFLLIMGVLESLAGGCTVVGGSVFSQMGNNTDSSGVFGAAGGILAGLGIFIIILGILQIAAGAGALGGRNWARWLGIVVSIIFALIAFLGALGSMTAQNGTAGGAAGIVLGALYALTAFALITAGSYFSYRR